MLEVSEPALHEQQQVSKKSKDGMELRKAQSTTPEPKNMSEPVKDPAVAAVVNETPFSPPETRKKAIPRSRKFRAGVATSTQITSSLPDRPSTGSPSTQSPTAPSEEASERLKSTPVANGTKSTTPPIKSKESSVEPVSHDIFSPGTVDNGKLPTLSTPPVKPAPTASSSSSTGSSTAQSTPPRILARPARDGKSPASQSSSSAKGKSISAPAAKPLDDRVDAERPFPQPVTPFAPATYETRLQYIHTIVKELEAKNVRFPNRIAMKLEHNIAKSTSKVIYPNSVRKLVVDIRNERFGKAGQKKAEEEKKAKEETLKKQLRDNLEKLIIPPKMLESNEYVVGLVIPQPVPDDYVAVCERCNNNFIPKSKNTQSTCYYHWARLPYDFINKKRSNIYPCCSQPADQSTGCTTSQRHVYKLRSAQHMAGVIPFVPTPLDTGPHTLFAAGIDCEMGYTDFGVELIRVTVVDWDTGKTVLDRTVFPYGEVIDLNTRFSGVSSLDDGVTLDDVHYPTITFNEARKALFEYISASTIIIGHGLENDLNALRLLHIRVVDTAIRYPTLNEKRKHSLKSLAHTYLGRTIQTGEHDSAEDALAAIDIVKANIKKHLPL